MNKWLALSSKILIATVVAFAIPAPSLAQVSVGLSVDFGPPAIPAYVQPPCPQDGDIWTPGYWAYGPDGYYWVAGEWVAAPQPGLLWTPGYWAWSDGAYFWHRGYWGRTVGFYGGIDYGFGYYGVGFVGGEWAGPIFRYNAAVTNVDRTIVRDVYIDKTVIVNEPVRRVSYNGGPGGVPARPTDGHRPAATEPHVPPAAPQRPPATAATNNGFERFDAMRGNANPSARGASAPAPRSAPQQSHAPAPKQAQGPRDKDHSR